ncbi:MAG: hypothetical protein NTY53_09305, partial [Kiritimatiellaeota bacterium]|nr:hypothetical protein [Kiritimatiellota bacterium]
LRRSSGSYLSPQSRAGSAGCPGAGSRAAPSLSGAEPLPAPAGQALRSRWVSLPLLASVQLLLCSVAGFAADTIGQKLAENAQATFWCASSGWKIRPDLPVPTATAERAVVRAARNETEAVQIIITPHTNLSALTVSISDFTGPQGAKLPAAIVDILRVAYVNITEPTDKSAQAGLWPDPLPPLTAPLDLPANKHQPFWLRVTVPRDATLGIYSAQVKFAARDFAMEVPLEVEVYGFTLPDQMTCQSAFGFSPGTVFRYHGVKSESDKRTLLAKYFDSFASHHISPYDPAPLDPIRITWPSVKRPPSKWSDWEGVHIVTNEVAHGCGALALFDDNHKACISAAYTPRILNYRSALPGHEAMVSLNHYNADGKWMSGCNNDIVLDASGRWEKLDLLLTNFPAGAKSVELRLWATKWTDAGEKTGLTWFDDVSLRAANGGPELIRGGDFEPPEFGDSGATEEQLQVGLDFSARRKIPIQPQIRTLLSIKS